MPIYINNVHVVNQIHCKKFFFYIPGVHSAMVFNKYFLLILSLVIRNSEWRIHSDTPP